MNGPPRPAAVAAAACLVQGLPATPAAARDDVLYLLFQLAAAAADDVDLRREVAWGLPVYAEIAETGTDGERASCIDLLSFCGRFGGEAGRRSVAVLRRMAEFDGAVATAVAVELADLESDGHLTS